MGDKRVVVAGVVAGDDGGEGMQCSDHPYRSNPGGICAFCLQEKLGKLVSSSKSSPFFAPLPSSSSSSPTSFPPDGFGFDFGVGAGGLAGSTSSSAARTAAGGGSRTRISFLAAAHKKKKSSSYLSSGGSRKVMASTTIPSSSSSAANNLLTLKRSKSVAPRPVGGLAEGGYTGIPDAVDSPRKKSFWSFLYLSSSSSTSTSSSSANNNSGGGSNRRRSTSSSSGGGGGGGGDKHHHYHQQPSASDKAMAKEETKTPKREHGGGGGGEEVESPSGSQASSSFGRKVARSRSVGCGSRSFSGDFLERISTGFGDCTLRRVESHREAKPKMHALHLDDDGEDDEQQRRIKERVKCGGLFGGFGMISSSYWLSADDFDSSSSSSRISSAAPASHGAAARGGAGAPGGRGRSWGWAFASPMRAFRPALSSSKPSYAIKNGTTAATTASVITAINASNNIINGAGGGSTTSNKLGANPSLLAVGS